MCGIFGLIERHGLQPAVLEAMSRLIRHRGPDGEGFVLLNERQGSALPLGGKQTPTDAYSLASVGAPRHRIEHANGSGATIGLGHRRLAIVDLSASGHQPMASVDGRFWISFNGEIYNHIELRKELQAEGFHFESHSDTEVILAAYRRWGVDCLTRLNGMWAFVLYDMHERKFFIARDRFGVKPLYFWRDGSAFAFASEIKAFFAHPRFTATPFIENLRGYLLDGPTEYVEDTAFVGVHRLKASSYILATAENLLDGQFQQVSWWRLHPNDGAAVFDEARAERCADEYFDLLRSAVDLRLRADVTVGSALSGGLDSSSVVYLVAQQIQREGSRRKQETFSSVYRSPGTEHCDESPYIEQVGRQLDVHLNTIEPLPQGVPAEHARMIWCMDTPPESTCMSGWHTFKLVNSRGIKVTLDGQGADEQLAGYLSYLPIQMAQMGLRAPLELPHLLSVHAPRVAFGAVALAMGARAVQYLQVSSRVRGRRGQMLRQLRGGLNAALVEDSFSGLSNLLHYGDRVSMAFGVESRMPFLDYRLAEYLAQVPGVYKIQRGWTKYLARRAFTNKLPDSVVWRKDKMGWPIPEQHWESGSLATWFAAPRDSAKRMSESGLGKEFTAALDSQSITLRVRALNLDSWYRTFIDGGWRGYQ